MCTILKALARQSSSRTMVHTARAPLCPSWSCFWAIPLGSMTGNSTPEPTKQEPRGQVPRHASGLLQPRETPHLAHLLCFRLRRPHGHVRALPQRPLEKRYSHGGAGAHPSFCRQQGQEPISQLKRHGRPIRLPFKAKTGMSPGQFRKDG